jgi:hypothetical protein
MTKEELGIIKQLSILGKRIKNLPEIYEDPENELSSQVFLHINALERIVFAREGLRAYTKVAAGELIAKLEADLKPGTFVVPNYPDAKPYTEGMKIPKGWYKARIPYTHNSYMLLPIGGNPTINISKLLLKKSTKVKKVARKSDKKSPGRPPKKKTLAQRTKWAKK